MRAPVDHIAAPRSPAKTEWVNVAMLRMDQQIGRPVLIEFWDFCRPNSMRTLPYVKVWDARYPDLRVIGMHTAGFEPSRDSDAVRAAVARLGIEYAVAIDAKQEIWRLYDNLGWPARYLFTADGYLHSYHYGEGGYEETELEIQELSGLMARRCRHYVPRTCRAPCWPCRATTSRVCIADRTRPAGFGRCSPGSEPCGERPADAVDHPGAYELIAHERSTAGLLELSLEGYVECHAVCFTPGLA